MLRMSFMGHLEELRSRLLRAIGGLLVVFVLSIGFCKDLWNVVSAPAVTALTASGHKSPKSNGRSRLWSSSMSSI